MLTLVNPSLIKGDGKEYNIPKSEFIKLYIDIFLNGYATYENKRVVLSDSFDRKKIDIDEVAEILKEINKDILASKLKEDQIIEKIITTLDETERFNNFLDQKDAETSLFMKYAKSVKNDFSEQMNKMHSEVKSFVKDLEHLLEEYVSRNAPNLNKLVGYKVGARLLRAMGGLRNLALTSSSTIQIVGAEKAFFRFKKGKGSPPKHGIIYEIPDIYRAPERLSGKISRAYSNAIVKAARADLAGLESQMDIKLKSKLDEIRREK